MASGIYNQFKYDLMNKVVNLTSDTIKVGLLNNSHTFANTSTSWADISSNEITGTGYTAGGATLSGKVTTEGATTSWSAASASWTSASFSAYHAVLYDASNSNNLICSFDFGGIKSVTNSTFSILFNSASIGEILTLAEV